MAASLVRAAGEAGIPSKNVASAITGSRDMQFLCYALSVRAGWWKDIDSSDPYVFGTKISLIHSEISEALEGGRKDLKDSHLPDRPAAEVELADAVIRIFDLAGARGYDLAGAIEDKLVYNLTRPDHAINKRAEPGGKKF